VANFVTIRQPKEVRLEVLTGRFLISLYSGMWRLETWRQNTRFSK